MRILKNSPRSSHMALIGVIEPSHLLTLYQLQVYAHFSGVWALQVTTLLASVVVGWCSQLFTQKAWVKSLVSLGRRSCTL